MDMLRVAARITREQRAALEEHGGGDLSRGLRSVIADYLGVGPVEVPKGLAAADPDTRREVSQAGIEARWPEPAADSLESQVSNGATFHDDSPVGSTQG